ARRRARGAPRGCWPPGGGGRHGDRSWQSRGAVSLAVRAICESHLVPAPPSLLRPNLVLDSIEQTYPDPLTTTEVGLLTEPSPWAPSGWKNPRHGQALLPLRGDELRQVDCSAAGRPQLRGARSPDPPRQA